jgi:uncharacterized protein (TIGR02246 family)
MKRLWFPLAICFCSAIACTLCADQAADEASIRNNVEAYVVAYNDRDAETLASFWSPDAVYMNPKTGEEVIGLQAIIDQFTSIFADGGDGKLSVDVQSVAFISPTVAVERGTAVVVGPDTEPDNTNYSAVHVKRDGKWLLDRVSEEEAPVVHSSYEQLKELEWMVGQWTSAEDDAEIEVDCDWTKNQNFLKRAFKISIGGETSFSGMQLIGWDPMEKTVRSWTFDSNGTFAEATWQKKGDRWFLRNRGVLPDGRPATMINVMKQVDENSFTWQTIERTAGEELLPNIDEIQIVRR